MPPRPDKHAHCGYCGAAYAAGQPWPRRCAACENISYRNPIPVAVAVIPVDRGLLAIRRDIEPRRGFLALPGGFIDHGEAWTHAVAREVREETGFEVDPAEVTQFAVKSAPDGTLLVFGLTAPRTRDQLGEFRSDGEVSGFAIVEEPCEMAFPLHEEVVRTWFAAQPPR